MSKLLTLMAAGLAAFTVAACGGLSGVAGNPDPAPNLSPAAQSAALSAVPTVTGTCTIDPPPSLSDPYADGWSAPAYTVTLTDTSAVDVDVSQIASIFYGQDGREAGSDQQEAGGIISPGESLSWVFDVPSPVLGPTVSAGTVTAENDGGAYWNDGDDINQVTVMAATCQFAQWG
jgi:hypothetical protein